MARYRVGTKFGGNPFIRKGGIGHQYSVEELAEMKKCADDPIYFIEKYVYIKSVDDENSVLFTLRDYQLDMVSKMMHNREFICKLPRQVGKTVCVSATLLWHLLFNKNYSILVAAHQGNKARDVLAGIKNMYEALPAFLQAGILEWNKGNIILDTGSRVRATASSGTAARGDVYNCVYIDEAAFLMTHIAEHFFQSVIPTISSGKTTKIFVTSTPKGMNHFYNMWEAAVSGKSGYAWTEIKWDDVPGRDEKFKAKIVSQFGINYWNQEFGAEFVGSSHTLIAASKLLMLQGGRPLVQSPITRVYAHPNLARQYVACADVSEGVLGDYSTTVVFDTTSLPYTIACVYRNNAVSTMAYPAILRNIGKTYNNALLMVETTGIGQEVANGLLHDLEYENTALTQPSKKAVGKVLSGLFSGTKQARVGLRMDKQAKAIGCGKLKAMIEGDQLLVCDEWVVQELRRFARNKKGSYSAEEGHDDLAMCLVQFAWMVDQGYMKETNDLSVSAAVRQKQLNMIEEVEPVIGMGLATVPSDVPVAAKDDWWHKWANDTSKDPEAEVEMWDRINARYTD